MAQGRPVGHHFLPRFYLKAFSFENREIPPIWVHEKDHVPRILPISVVAKETHLYSTKKNDQESRDTINETVLGKIEDYIAPVFRKILENEGNIILSTEEKTHFAAFVLLMSDRTPRAFRIIDKSFKKHEVETYHKAMGQMTDKDFKIVYESVLSRHPEMQNVSFAEAKQIMLEGPTVDNIRLSHSAGIYSMWASVEQMLPVVMKMDWKFWVPDDNRVFFTSDDPVVATIRDERGLLRPLKPGWGHPSVEVTLPLAPRLCCCVSHGGGTGRLLLGDEGVPFMNELRVIMSNRFIYSSRKLDLGGSI
ncbi:MAG: DUF4238 domain-containing protein [Candidatus Peribacter sp.]|nr:DUF4238 domain-containing protein [Candidatus Peribacter sp.]